MDSDSENSSVNSDIGGMENEVEYDFDVDNTNNFGTVNSDTVDINNIGSENNGNEHKASPSRSFSKE